MKVTDDDYTWPMRVDGRWYHHVTGFLEAMKHRENHSFAEAIRKERSASIAREMGDDERVLWADIEFGKRKLTERETRWFEQNKYDLRAKALVAKFSDRTLWREVEFSRDPEAVAIVNIIRTASRNLSRDPIRTGHLDRRNRWSPVAHLANPAD